MKIRSLYLSYRSSRIFLSIKPNDRSTFADGNTITNNWIRFIFYPLNDDPIDFTILFSSFHLHHHFLIMRSIFYLFIISSRS